jgi:hypothetical protein
LSQSYIGKTCLNGKIAPRCIFLPSGFERRLPPQSLKF